MTCQQCLAELATGSLRDLTEDSEVMQHAMTCSSCGPLTTRLREREYHAANTLNFLGSQSNAATVAETAIRTARRRRIGGVVVALTGAALGATIWLAIALTDPFGNGGSPSTGRLRTETLELSCLSPDQAGDIINPYVRTRGSTYYVGSSGLSAITVRGTPEELAKARSLIDKFESDPGAACRTNPALPGGAVRVEVGPVVVEPVPSADVVPAIVNVVPIKKR